MKVIFLDFDGVITTPNGNLSTEKMNLVERIIKETGARIVISSSWRSCSLEKTLETLSKEMFSLSKYVVGITKRLYIMDGDGECYGSLRGIEIAEYVDSHNVENYVIIDDDLDMLLEQKKYLVKINTFLGLQESDIEKAIKILNENE